MRTMKQPVRVLDAAERAAKVPAMHLGDGPAALAIASAVRGVRAVKIGVRLEAMSAGFLGA